MKEWYKIKGKHLKNMADKFRGYLGTTADIPPEIMDEQIDEVYNKQYHEFWDSYQSNGTRKSYQYAFGGYGWNDDNFKPKYDLQPTDALGMFIVTQIIDLRESALGIKLDFSKATRFTNMFSYALTKYVGVVDTQSTKGTLEGVFQNSSIISIEEFALRTDGSQTPKNIFTGCSALEHLIVTGVIGKNGFNVSACTKLDLESLLSILNALANKTGDTSASWVCTLGAANLAKLTDAQKAIATDKGWTLL